jgi:SAM-dependent methyltransferase
MQLANAYGESQTLLCANELGVFTAIGKGRRTAKEIARRCSADPEGMRLLLDALVSLGLISLARTGYRNTPLSRRYLDGNSPWAITNLLWLLGHHWQDWSKLPQALRKGRPGWATITARPQFRKRFSWAMHERSHALAGATVKAMRLPAGARRFLDLGGGPGSYALALARRYPKLTGVIVDQTTVVAKEVVRQTGMAGRVKVKEGNIFKDDLGADYDAILCSNVVHVFNDTENQLLLRRASKALRPGGRLFIVEFFLDDSRTHPANSAVFSVLMWLYTATGRCYSWREVEAWLRKIGFGKFRRCSVMPGIGVLEATKLGFR